MLNVEPETGIYLPEQVAPMLPTEAAVKAISLFKGRHNLALSFAVRFGL